MEDTIRAMLRDRDLISLLFRKKLHLVLDLDNTLVHTKRRDLLTSEEQKLTNLHQIAGGAFLVKLRPGVVAFLKEASTMFDLSIFTMGNNLYANYLARLLEKLTDVKFREVFSKEDCPDVPKQKLLDVVSSYERFVVIVDDNVDVWKECNKSNVVKIGDYEFFAAENDLNSRNSEVCKEGGDQEEAMDEELARVLGVLKTVHRVFYEHYGDGHNIGCAGRDVRQVLNRVQTRQEGDGVEAENGRYCQCWFEELMENSRKRRLREVYTDQPLISCDSSKRFKSCTVVGLPCVAC